MNSGGGVSGRSLALLTLAWIAGTAWQLRQPVLWSWQACALALSIGLAAIVVSHRMPIRFAMRRASSALAGLFLAGVLGAVCADTQAAWRLAEHLAPELEGRDLVVTGVVAGLPQRGPTGVRFRFDVESAQLDGRAVDVPQALALGWYRGYHEDAALDQPRTSLRAGERWRLAVRLRQPHGNLNPGGFDYELFLFEQGLRATGYVRDGAPQAHQRLDAAAGHPVERLRQRVREAIDAHVDDPRAAGVLAALAVGDQAAISREDWDLYRNAGVAHLMSISGLHVTMFAWLAGAAAGKAWRRSARLALRWPAPSAARWCGLAAATAYAVFSGWGVPSQRTVWMLATIALLQSLGLRWPRLMVLLASGWVVVLLDPWALLQAGFWLSFVAVALLMLSEPAHAPAGRAPVLAWWRRVAGWFARDLRTQVVATLGLAPLTLLFFQQLSLVGFAANLVAIPAVTLVITPLALLGIAAAPLWRLGALAVEGLDRYLGMLAGAPAAVWSVPAAPWWAQAGGLLAAVLVVMPLPWRLRLLAVPLALPLLVPPRVLPPPGSFDLIAADIGQGTSVLVRTSAHVLVFDTGPQYSSESDAGQRVLVPLLRRRGDTHVDRLVLSHRDLDHVGGAASLLASLDVDGVLSSLEDGHPLRAAARAHERCAAGQSWQWDGVRFDVLGPPAADYERTRKSNAMSCVLRIAGAGRSVLLTGDIEAEQEAILVAGGADLLASDVLIVPHHGSRTSSTPGFIDAVHPAVAVFQAGYRNRFGHPAPDVVDRYRQRGIAIVASPSCGAWRWLASDPVAGVCERDASRRYWHHGVAP
ncbi:MAG: DNA internalization-related competence protein ComEC/Rec2 [Proteobacteria bacterium]|nr:DNA internalization-related competence protein ComEC/Rec2 [Pseudomonadota bacterium]